MANKVYSLLLLNFFISSCSNSPIISHWEITNIKQEKNLYKYNFSSNILTFDKKGACFIPKVNLQKEYNCKCTYHVDHKEKNIHIKSCSPVFSGKFFLEIDSQNGILKLTNDSFYIVASDLMKRFNEKLQPAIDKNEFN